MSAAIRNGFSRRRPRRPEGITPGQWQFSPLREHIYSDGKDGETYRLIASVGERVKETDVHLEADIRVITAVPELLALAARVAQLDLHGQATPERPEGDDRAVAHAVDSLTDLVSQARELIAKTDKQPGRSRPEWPDGLLRMGRTSKD